MKGRVERGGVDGSRLEPVASRSIGRLGVHAKDGKAIHSDDCIVGNMV
jgi:hypothetical protein